MATKFAFFVSQNMRCKCVSYTHVNVCRSVIFCSKTRCSRPDLLWAHTIYHCPSSGQTAEKLHGVAANSSDPRRDGYLKKAKSKGMWGTSRGSSSSQGMLEVPDSRTLTKPHAIKAGLPKQIPKGQQIAPSAFSDEETQHRKRLWSKAGDGAHPASPTPHKPDEIIW